MSENIVVSVDGIIDSQELIIICDNGATVNASIEKSIGKYKSVIQTNGTHFESSEFNDPEGAFNQLVAEYIRKCCGGKPINIINSGAFSHIDIEAMNDIIKNNGFAFTMGKE